MTEERTVEELGASVVPSIFGSYYAEPEPVHEPKSRTGFILLGALLGAFGAHSFYAGYKKKGWAQLAITVFTLGFAAPMTWIWAIIDICTIDRDNYGVNFAA
jgi:TM2 domain-containing membrane protein YozV